MYEQYYHLTGKPFQLTPDPKFYFASKEHRRALSYLEYGLEQGEGFIVISGAVGSGKSTIAQYLLSRLDRNKVEATQLVSTRVDPLDLLRMIGRGFGVPLIGEESKAALLERIESYLKSLHRRGKRALLLVDEAQNLPAESLEELRMLSNIQIDNQPLLQSFLLGQEELQDTLRASNMVQFRQRIIASCFLHALAEEECQDYIEHRLNQVGWQGTPKFSADAFALIHKVTQGIPRLINIFCDRLMLFAFLEELDEINASEIEQVNQEINQEMHQDRTVRPPEAPPLNTAAPKSQETPLSKPATSSTFDNVQLFRQHLEEVFAYLDKSITEKMKVLKYLDDAIKEKHQQYEQEQLGTIQTKSDTSKQGKLSSS